METFRGPSPLIVDAARIDSDARSRRPSRIAHDSIARSLYFGIGY